MSISTRIIRYVALALVAAAVAAPVAQAASGSETRDAAFRAAHWQHEDAQYAARPVSAGSQPAGALVEPGDGVGLTRVLLVLGVAVGLFVLGAMAVTGVRRKHRGVAPS